MADRRRVFFPFRSVTRNNKCSDQFSFKFVRFTSAPLTSSAQPNFPTVRRFARCPVRLTCLDEVGRRWFSADGLGEAGEISGDGWKAAKTTARDGEGWNVDSVLVVTLLHGFKALICGTQAEMWWAAGGYGGGWRVVCTCEQSRSSPGKIVLNHRHRPTIISSTGCLHEVGL